MTLFDPMTLVILVLASYRITRFFIEDRLFDPIRDKIFDKWPPDSKMFSYLLTCYWCLGLWVSVGMVILFLLFPVPTLIGCAALAISSLVGLLDHYINKD